MDQAAFEASLVKILFYILFGFLLINIMLNTMLLYISKNELYRKLMAYWFSLAAVFILEGLLQNGTLPIVLAHSSSALPMSILSYLMFESLGEKFPLKEYFLLFVSCILVTFILFVLDAPFSIVAMPTSVANGIPLLHTAHLIFFKKRQRSTHLQKVLGIIFILMPIHSINFALFRMDPGAQFWGWPVAFGTYQCLAVLLSAFTLEEVARSEKNRLENLVQLRTSELSESYSLLNKESLKNKTFLKTLVHDIKNPLHTLSYCLEMLQQNSSISQKKYIDQINHSSHTIYNILSDVQKLGTVQQEETALDLSPVNFQECMIEITSLFDRRLKEKNIKLKVENELPAGAYFYAHKTFFIYSVLSNFLSNSLKFSPPHSCVTVRAEISGENILISVKDRGIGMTEDLLYTAFKDDIVRSSLGLEGEKGSGLGLHIAKTYIDLFGGSVQIRSISAKVDSANQGTVVSIFLPLAHRQPSKAYNLEFKPELQP